MTAPDVSVLTLNPGSSSLKVSVRTPATALSVLVERLDSPQARLTARTAGGPPRSRDVPDADVDAAVGAALAEVADAGLAVDAVSVRVVHGGPTHVRPELADDALVEDLAGLVPLAPLHLPGALAVLGAARRRLPGLPVVTCYDTAFHADLPEEDRRLPVSRAIADAGVRRYGFHGLSLEHVVTTLGPAALERGVVAHLGSGCSVTALAAGRPVHTSMSLTPTGGILSATRSGDLDPEVVLHLVETRGWQVPRLRRELDGRSGLAGLSGGRHDVRDLLADQDDDPAAALALAVFTRNVAMEVASCVPVLGGLTTLVFTGGVGEHAAPVRARICELLEPLGVQIDPAAAAPGDVAAPGSDVRIVVVTADEEAVLDRHAREVLGARAAGSGAGRGQA